MAVISNIWQIVSQTCLVFGSPVYSDNVFKLLNAAFPNFCLFCFRAGNCVDFFNYFIFISCSLFYYHKHSFSLNSNFLPFCCFKKAHNKHIVQFPILSYFVKEIFPKVEHIIDLMKVPRNCVLHLTRQVYNLFQDLWNWFRGSKQTDRQD